MGSETAHASHQSHEHDHKDEPELELELELGDIVTDRDDPDGTARAMVVNKPPLTAAEWEVYDGEMLLCEDNPSYPADAPVVVVVFLGGTEPTFDYYAGAEPIRLAYLNERHHAFYSFPQPRLQKCGSRSPTEVELDAIQPSPYHSHTFRESHNEQFIREIRDRGAPDHPRSSVSRTTPVC